MTLILIFYLRTFKKHKCETKNKIQSPVRVKERPKKPQTPLDI